MRDKHKNQVKKENTYTKFLLLGNIKHLEPKTLHFEDCEDALSCKVLFAIQKIFLSKTRNKTKPSPCSFDFFINLTENEPSLNKIFDAFLKFERAKKHKIQVNVDLLDELFFYPLKFLETHKLNRLTWTMRVVVVFWMVRNKILKRPLRCMCQKKILIDRVSRSLPELSFEKCLEIYLRFIFSRIDKQTGTCTNQSKSFPCLLSHYLKDSKYLKQILRYFESSSVRRCSPMIRCKNKSKILWTFTQCKVLRKYFRKSSHKRLVTPFLAFLYESNYARISTVVEKKRDLCLVDFVSSLYEEVHTSGDYMILTSSRIWEARNLISFYFA